VQRDSERVYDEYLVVAAQGGDRAAWERLVARWQPRLLRHAWRLTGQADRAADLVQDAWVDICAGWKTSWPVRPGPSASSPAAVIAPSTRPIASARACAN
jgi:hypothetical protein